MTAAPTSDLQPAPTRASRPFGLRDKAGYMVGDIGNNLQFFLQASFFLVFCTDVMGIKAGHVGTLLLVARIIDAFTDIVVGRLTDRRPQERQAGSRRGSCAGWCRCSPSCPSQRGSPRSSARRSWA